MEEWSTYIKQQSWKVITWKAERTLTHPTLERSSSVNNYIHGIQYINHYNVVTRIRRDALVNAMVIDVLDHCIISGPFYYFSPSMDK